MPTKAPAAPVKELLRAYLDSATLAEPLQGRIWAAAQLTLTQVRALRKIALEPRSLGQLGAELGLTAPSMTRVIDRLEERGLIERRRDDADRRRVVAAILPPGRSVVSSLPILDGSSIEKAVARMDPEERERILGAFRDFNAAVRAVEESEAP